jgi:CspA family cold shock protein
MVNGKVKWFNDAKGYGFIEFEPGKDVFVHYSVIEFHGFKSLQEGQQVAFELEHGPKGDHATKVIASMAA